MKAGEILELSPHGLAKDGESAARLENFLVFIPYAVPGDKLEVEIQNISERHARGKIKSILSPSPDRTEPPCPIFGKCGGCQMQHIKYEAQLRYKEEFLCGFVQHHAKFSQSLIKPIIAAQEPWHYRNKIQLAVGAGGKAGLFAPKSHEIIDMESCLIQSETGNDVLAALRNALKNANITPYNETTGSGDLKHILIKVGEEGKSALVVLVATRSPFPGESILIEALTKKLPLLKGIIVNINNTKGNRILGDINILKWGEENIEETISGLRFKISGGSFFQVHTEQINSFYKVLAKWLPEYSEGAAFDAYAGVGTFSSWLAKRFKNVTHIEINPDAVKIAAMNAQLNNISNISFVAEDVEKGLAQLKKDSWGAGLLDPPRSGLTIKVIDQINKMEIKNLIYISCNPATLIRDLNLLLKKYNIMEIQPVDLFPHTGHLEVMVNMQQSLLSKINIAQKLLILSSGNIPSKL